MNRYKNFRTEDFIWDTFFRLWVLSPNREINLAWKKWLEENPEMLSVVTEAKNIVLALRVREPEISDEEIARIVSNVVSKTKSPGAPRFRRQEKVFPFHKRRWLMAAASMLLLLGLGTLLHSIYNKENFTLVHSYSNLLPAFKEKHTTTTNTTNESMVIHLDDDSKITLAPNGSVKYPKQFENKKREVTLSGEAFFEVAKDPQRPFFVYANGLVTKVLGTSFTIKADSESPEVSVEVKTGRVSVFSQLNNGSGKGTANHELAGIILSPNQKVIYAREELRMVKTLVEEPQIVVPQSQVPYFRFEDTPMSEVFSSVAKAYGIDILYDEDLMSRCPLTATLENQSLHDKLTIICKAVEANYEILDGQIVVHGAGCKN
jgi:transmembrane sensor